MERRNDRKEKIIKILNDNDFKDDEYEIVKAIDGLELKETDKDLLLFLGNDFNNRKGFIGCALSHYKLWQKLQDDKEHNYYIILEDDFIPSKDMKTKLNNIVNDMENKELIFFGYHMLDKCRNNIKHIYNIECDNTKIDKLNTSVYIGGTHGYSINKNGAKLLIKYVEDNGIKHGIDFIMGRVNGGHFYETQPHLCFADWNEYGQEIDSDIQNIYSHEHTIKIVPTIINNPNNLNNIKSSFIKIINLEKTP